MEPMFAIAHGKKLIYSEEDLIIVAKDTGVSTVPVLSRTVLPNSELCAMGSTKPGKLS
jgi:23S rRNA-/tRNA-specific pseudouridylate synthase